MERLSIAPIVLAVTILATAAGPSRKSSLQAADGWADFWASLEQPTRIGFVMGYIQGYGNGNKAGCDKADEVAESKGLKLGLSLDCSQYALTFSKPPEFYEARMTDYYSRYPSDPKASFRRVLELLSDLEHKTPDDIHQILKR